MGRLVKAVPLSSDPKIAKRQLRNNTLATIALVLLFVGAIIAIWVGYPFPTK